MKLARKAKTARAEMEAQIAELQRKIDVMKNEVDIDEVRCFLCPGICESIVLRGRSRPTALRSRQCRGACTKNAAGRVQTTRQAMVSAAPT